jgi:hypothetical protein
MTYTKINYFNKSNKTIVFNGISDRPLSDQQESNVGRGPKEGDLRLVGGRSEEEVRFLFFDLFFVFLFTIFMPSKMIF